jgi:hypothetical protein
MHLLCLPHILYNYIEETHFQSSLNSLNMLAIHVGTIFFHPQSFDIYINRRRFSSYLLMMLKRSQFPSLEMQ